LTAIATKTAGNSTVARFDPTCRDCQQKERNEKKNAGRDLQQKSRRPNLPF